MGTKQLNWCCSAQSGYQRLDVWVWTWLVNKVASALRDAWLLYQQEFGDRQPVGIFWVACSKIVCGMVCRVLISWHIVLLVWARGLLDVYYPVASIDIKLCGLITNVAQNQLAVWVVEYSCRSSFAEIESANSTVSTAAQSHSIETVCSRRRPTRLYKLQNQYVCSQQRLWLLERPLQW